MEWEDIGKATGKLFLTVIEYSFKLCAGVAACITIGTRGSFSQKIAAGFGSLSQVLHNLVQTPSQMMEMGTIINAYHTQTAAMFTETYGVNALNGLLLRLNGTIEYLIDIYQNFSGGPLVTIAATLLVFLSFYLLAWVLRFARQKGRGSFLVRMERKLGERIFRRKKSGIQTSPAPSQEAKPAVNRQFKTQAKHRIPSRPGTGPQKAVKKPDDLAPDSQTLNYILKSARSSSS